MSEFSKLSKFLESAAEILKKQNDIDLSVLDLQRIGDFAAHVSKLKFDLAENTALAAKYVLKKAQKDEITGALRFGPSMCTKIDKANEEAMTLLTNSQILFERIQSRIVELEQICEQSPAIHRETQHLVIDSAFDLAIHDKQIEARKKEEERVRQQLEDQRREEERLHQKAEELRLQRLQKIDDYRNQLRQLLYAASKCNDQSYRTFTHFLDEEGQRIDLVALETVSELLEQIGRQPDKINLRKLRLDHPALWGKVTGTLNGLLLLLFIGFELRVEGMAIALKADGVSPAEPALQGVDDEKQLVPAEIMRLVAAGVGVCEVAKDIKVVLVLSEPDPADSANWIKWFDGLTACRDQINDLITQRLMAS